MKRIYSRTLITVIMIGSFASHSLVRAKEAPEHNNDVARQIFLTPEGKSDATQLFADRTIGNLFAILSDEDQAFNMIGVWDQDGDGLENNHEVGIWKLEDGKWVEVLTAMVPSGTSSELINGYRYVPIPETVMPTKTPYVIGAVFYKHGDRFYDAMRGGSPVSVDTGIRLDSSVIGNGDQLFERPTSNMMADWGPGRWAPANLIYKKEIK